MWLAQDKGIGRYLSHYEDSCLNHENFTKLRPLAAKSLHDRLQSQERDAIRCLALVVSCHSLSVNRSSNILFFRFHSPMPCRVLTGGISLADFLQLGKEWGGHR
jgi:hypothetical protein